MTLRERAKKLKELNEFVAKTLETFKRDLPTYTDSHLKTHYDDRHGYSPELKELIEAEYAKRVKAERTRKINLI